MRFVCSHNNGNDYQNDYQLVDWLICQQVHIQLGAIQHQQNDDEDFEGSGLDGYPSAARQVTIPIQCHSEPNFPISFGDKMDDDNVMVRGNV